MCNCICMVGRAVLLGHSSLPPDFSSSCRINSAAIAVEGGTRTRPRSLTVAGSTPAGPVRTYLKWQAHVPRSIAVAQTDELALHIMQVLQLHMLSLSAHVYIPLCTEAVCCLCSYRTPAFTKVYTRKGKGRGGRILSYDRKTCGTS